MYILCAGPDVIIPLWRALSAKNCAGAQLNNFLIHHKVQKMALLLSKQYLHSKLIVCELLSFFILLDSCMNKMHTLHWSCKITFAHSVAYLESETSSLYLRVKMLFKMTNNFKVNLVGLVSIVLSFKSKLKV